ncbi:alkylhydroperoxidase-related (seleno)protein [Candidatus Poriferisocius sp.]|uniref:alkylhydroperoxidase-related (seleno)protein n=1 Tax=Candidatus Poriferisocius sp. TaxID=3101276 RepID=UPI003B01C1DC
MNWPLPSGLDGLHSRIWEQIAGSGSWWTGEERVAMVEAARRAWDCGRCAERRAALSPAWGELCGGTESVLDDVVVDAVHRVVTDAPRLTRTWLDELNQAGITDDHYVELLGVVTCALNIDEFNRVLGIALDPLPAPRPGSPDNYRPANAVRNLHWVPTLDPVTREESEADLFSGARTGNVIRSLSLVPDAMRMAMALTELHYVPTQFVADMAWSPGRSLNRPQIEFVATRVSERNGCVY